MTQRSLALFDFDGTITSADTLFEFIRFHKGWLSFLGGFALLSPILVAMKFGVIPNWKAKQLVLRYFFGGSSLADFQSKCNEFSEKRLPTLIRAKAVEEIKGHLQKGNRVVVVSASAENWIRKWAEDIQVELLATQLEINSNVITGNIAGRNCHGIEKVARIQRHLKLDDYDTIYAYGDSSGDKEMLELAKHRHYKPFR